MVFDYTAPTDLQKQDSNPFLLAQYSKLSTKLPAAINTEKKAHPFWTAASGIASSFIPFGLGAFITPTASFLVNKHKQQEIDKLNSYRQQLGLAPKTDLNKQGLDLGGLGYSLGQNIQSATGISATNEITGGGGEQQKTYNFTPAQEYMPTAPAQTGGGVTGLEGLPNTGYFGNGGGGTGLLSQTQNGYSQAPQVLRNGGKIQGGKINAPSHEEGGVNLVDEDGNSKGIEVEGDERIVNDKDWTKVLSFLKSGKSKNALALLKDIDKREPKEKGYDGMNLGATPTGYYDFNGGTTQYDPNFANTYPPQTNIQDNAFAPTTNPITGQVVQSPTQTKLPVTQGATPNKFDYSEMLKYGLDVGKLGLGLNAAMQTLPQYQIPKEWSDHMDRARYFSEQGLLPEEKAQALDLSNNAYATQVRDLTNASGGNAGALLGNLVAANQNRYKIANQLALADRQAKEASFDKYEGRLAKDVAMKKAIFDQKYNQALANKTEGMGLASDALANISGRMDFNKYYGNGSYYDKLQKALVAKGESEADTAKKMAEFASSPYFVHMAETYKKDPSALTDAKVEEDIKKIQEGTTKGADKILNPDKTSYADYLTWKSNK